MGRLKGVKQTGLVAATRRARTAQREAHKAAIVAGMVSDDRPEPLVPDLFREIQDTDWQCLKAVPDPRSSSNVVSPLSLILHRILAGFLGGAQFIGVFFPPTHRRITSDPEGPARSLGALPTQPAVYAVLRRINWQAAQVALAPLWERVGYTPSFVIRRNPRDPKELLEEFRREQAEKVTRKAAEQKAAQQAADRTQGMSAAKATRLGQPSRSRQPRLSAPPQQTDDLAPVVEQQQGPGAGSGPQGLDPIRHDLLLDGKVVKASYNTGTQERFVHVTHVTSDEQEHRHRFIIGVRPTVLNRHGEWGAACSL